MEIDVLSPKLMEIFNYLHSHPEISWKEFNTTEYIYSIFERKNCKVTKFDDIPGLIIEVGNGKPVIALRADIDALWQEVNGEFQANHSCGHDAHMTIVIGVLLYLLNNEELIKGTYRFIFQPAEEKGTGALKIIDKGIVDDVDFLYGMHLRPAEELKNKKFSPAIQHGAAKFIEGRIIGEDAHGARPHLNTNAIQVGAELFQLLNNIRLNPMIPYSIKLTSFKSGGDNINIIPGTANFSIDVRAQTNEVMTEMTNRLDNIRKGLELCHNVSIHLDTVSEIVGSVLNKDAVDIMEKSIIDSVGKENLTPIIQTSGGDDFHYYAVKRPKIKATMLAIGCDLRPGLHHPNMTFDHDSILTSINILINALLNTSNQYFNLHQ